jgi:hypothetical protein
MKADQPGADNRGAVPGEPRDTETPSHQRASYNDPLPGGDPTAPGAPNEPGGEAFTHVPNPSTSKALDVDDHEKGIPGSRHDAG